MKDGTWQGSPPRHYWLCIAYAFPPINRSGTHRTLAFVKHLDRLGWDATVLTVDPHDEPVDEALLQGIPASTRIVRTDWMDPSARVKAFLRTCNKTAFARREATLPHGRVSGRMSGAREWISRLLKTPDSRVGWIPSAVRAGLHAIRRRRPEVIFSTSPYMSAHLIALVLGRYTRIPWVADFRDPWVDNPYRDLRFASLRRWDAWLEALVVRSASHVVCTTPTLKEQLGRRFRSIEGRSSTILNGVDRELFKDVPPVRVGRTGDFVLLHAGQFYGPRSPHVWFGALRRIARQLPERAGRLRFVLLGPDTFEGRPLADLAAQAGVAAHVDVLGMKGHADTLSYLAGSDALALAGTEGTGANLQVPNKLFEYLAARKPILAVVAPESPVVLILQEARADAIVCEPGCESALADAIIRLATRTPAREADLWGGVERFDRARRADELAETFHRVARVVGPKTYAEKRPRPLQAVDQKRIRPAFTPDGGLRAVTGQNSRLIRQREEIVAKVPHQSSAVTVGEVNPSDASGEQGVADERDPQITTVQRSPAR
jgi:glycosyltransferase involved in cell wall biosynthesis